MEALFDKLHSKFITYDWYKTDRNKEMTKQLKAEIIEILSSQLEAQVKPANGDILKTINEFFDDYFLDKDNCFYIDSLTFKNKINFAARVVLQLKIDLLSRLSV